MQIGDLELHMISAGMARSDAGGPFGLVPRPLFEAQYPPDGANQIPMALNCLLLRSDDETILIDSGLGDKLPERARRQWVLDTSGGTLLENLAAVGVAAEDVSLVINTHLHYDHCGGNTRWVGEEARPVFPNARYLVQRMEWADASHPDARTRGSYASENFSPLLASGQMRLLHGDEQITRHLRCVVTPGHTAGHQSVLLAAGDWRGLYLGDMAMFTVHTARLAWLTSYDVLPLENIRSKQRWQRWAIETGAWLFSEHDPYLAISRLAEQNGRIEVLPIPEAAELTAELPSP